MDSARRKTDKMLNDLERRIQAVYASDPALLRIERRFKKYMDEVNEATHEAYTAYKNAPLGEMRDALKKEYVQAVRKLTVENRQYRDIVSEFSRIMANVNQQALDIANAEMTDIYTLNYNQIAVDCRKIGIEVDG